MADETLEAVDVAKKAALAAGRLVEALDLLTYLVEHVQLTGLNFDAAEVQTVLGADDRYKHLDAAKITALGSATNTLSAALTDAHRTSMLEAYGRAARST